MISGPADVLSCPFCGGKKEFMSLASGNTFRATIVILKFAFPPSDEQMEL